jgi:uncharacterized protein
MKFSLEQITDKNFIASYEQDHVIVKNGLESNARQFDSNTIISPNQIIESWQLSPQSLIDTSSAQRLLSLQPEFIILATAKSINSSHSNIINQFTHQQIGVDIMNLGAACRTYNLVVAEDRQVALIADFAQS